jgi:nicotinate (nicotinamide) nucleotide adenylyltransferase
MNQKGDKVKLPGKVISFHIVPLDPAYPAGSGTGHVPVIPLRQTLVEFKNLREPSVVILRKASRGLWNPEGSLGIFPASFNPPTKAHLALIREARERIHLDEILVLLDLQAMDKRFTGATWEERIAMLEILFQKDTTISIGLSNRGLFLDKIGPLRAVYPSPTRFTFIVGFDTVIRILDKKYYRNRKKSLDELFEQSRFLVANRDDYEETAFELLFRKRENKRYQEKIGFFLLPKKYGSLSSSSVRNRIAEGRSINDLVPISILRYIKRNGIYL